MARYSQKSAAIGKANRQNLGGTTWETPAPQGAGVFFVLVRGRWKNG